MCLRASKSPLSRHHPFENYTEKGIFLNGYTDKESAWNDQKQALIARNCEKHVPLLKRKADLIHRLMIEPAPAYEPGAHLFFADLVHALDNCNRASADEASTRLHIAFPGRGVGLFNTVRIRIVDDCNGDLCNWRSGKLFDDRRARAVAWVDSRDEQDARIQAGSGCARGELEPINGALVRKTKWSSARARQLL